MNADPQSCLVIEDSETGILAARAAAMQVWHFAGGAHVRAGYRLPPDVVPDRTVADMRELLDAFRHIGLC
jgi:beta-phosphoglucomutase-like phosphatase (HAD superfamily)